MRILVLHQDLFFQGGQYVAAKIITGLVARGYEVHLALSKVHADIARDNPNAKPFEIPDSVIVHILPSRRALYNVLPIARLIRRLKPDIVMPHVGHYMQAAVLARMAAFSRVPIVYVEHNAGPGPRVKGVRGFIQRAPYAACNHIIAVSMGVKQALEERYALRKNRVTTVYNPVLDTAFSEKLALPPSHPWLKNKDGRYVFVAAGAMTNGRKGFDLLLQAFAMVHKNQSNTQLVIFGRGYGRDALVQQARDLRLSNEAVAFPGFTDSLPAEMSAADCFVLSSRRETFGIVIVEALAAGTSVISFDCPVGPREVLDGGRLGALVPVGNIDELAAAMLKAATSPKQDVPFDGMCYTLDYVMDRYEEVIRNVLS